MSCQQNVTLDLKEVSCRRAHKQHVFITPFVLWKTYPLQRIEVFSTSKSFIHWNASQLWEGYWRKEPLLEDADEKELASSTLRSIALNYIQHTRPNPPKALVKALSRSKKRNDIVVTKPDKGSGVVVMDKPEYIRLSAASADNTSKFTHVENKRPKMGGRPPKHFHPLLQKEKELHET